MKLKQINRMNKKGSMLLRDLMFSVLIFSTIIVLGSIFVNDMANTYMNTNMTEEYSEFNAAGDRLLLNTTTATTDLDTTARGTNEGVWGVLSLSFRGVGTFLFLLFGTPFYIGNFVASAFIVLNIDSTLFLIIKNFIAGILYIIIAFGIGTAISRGSKM